MTAKGRCVVTITEAAHKWVKRAMKRENPFAGCLTWYRKQECVQEEETFLYVTLGILLTQEDCRLRINYLRELAKMRDAARKRS